ncbi:P-loop containing nucleoside triphosphate hydrolase protein [Xylariales sp. AK1849]|nr:P-loop containing nucleoside triphosphate hydrolase protein [Xylariales sp. AK1849]
MSGISPLAIPSGLGLAGIVLLSLRSIHSCLYRNGVQDIYRDEDGQSRANAANHFKSKWLKASLVLCSIIGLSLAAISPVLAKDHHASFDDITRIAAWGLLIFETITLVTTRRLTVAYSLGMYLALSCGVLVVVRPVQEYQLGWRTRERAPTDLVLLVVELASTICLGLGGISIARRPDVYHNGQVVDKMYTKSVISRLTWSWPNELLSTATKKGSLDLDDLPRPSRQLRAEEISRSWNNHEASRSPLWLELIAAHKWALSVQWLGSLCEAILSIAPQWSVLQFLRSFEEDQTSGDVNQHRGWIWVFALGVAILTQTWVESYTVWVSWSQVALPIRAQLSSLIFQKASRRKDSKGVKERELPVGQSTNANAHGSSVSEGKDQDQQSTVNLIGVDTMRISEFSSVSSVLLGSIVKLIVSLTFLFNLIGWKAVLSGLSTLAIFTPANVFFSRRYSAIQGRLMRVRDEKTAVVSEALYGMRQIKFSAQESQWEDKISAVRKRELVCIWKAFVNNTFLLGCFIASPIVLSAVSLAVYALETGELEPSVAFVSLGVFKALEMTLSVIPGLITNLLDAHTSVRRIEEYLQGAEISKGFKTTDQISFSKTWIAWPTAEDDPHAGNSNDGFVLRDVTITFPEGKLSVISGKTGSGKSLLLEAILGECDILHGSLSVPKAPVRRYDHKANKNNWIIPGAIAYVAQVPWIENTTIKENILFSLPYDHERYRGTIRACALQRDLESFIGGDNTEVGVNGVSLSGGQKWRITLARAIYSRAGILVMDDIFSAVDTHVGRHIMENCLDGPLGVGRTRILATHHSAMCKSKASYFVKLDKGRVLTAKPIKKVTLEAETPPEPLQGPGDTADHQDIANSTGTPDVVDVNDAPAHIQPGSTVERSSSNQEARSKGAVKREIYETYLRASGGWVYWVLGVGLYLLVQSLVIGRSWWLKIWTEGDHRDVGLKNIAHDYVYSMSLHQTQANVTILAVPGSEPRLSLEVYLGVYGLLAIATALLSTSKQYYIFSGSIKASQKLFARLSLVVLHAPIRWLDVVPVGRILNRFTLDMNAVDTRLASSVAFAGTAFMNLIGIVFASLLVSYFIFVFAAFIMIIYYWLASRYLTVGRPLKRLESTSISPLLEMFGSALTGVATVRSFGKVQLYLDRFYQRIDDLTVASWYLWLFNRWVVWRMGVIGSLFACCVAAFVLLAPNIDSAQAGFVLGFTLEFTGHVINTMRRYTNLELEMNAAERVVEYTKLETETLNGESPPAAWPTEGAIEFENYVAGYADLPPTIKDLTFRIQGNDRVGVVGRTGAGKSSLTLALFRFLEARSGNIRIDGLDISKLKLHDLRSRMAIIPQDPFLFKGTVRSNIDPFGMHEDAVLINAIKRVHLGSETDTSAGTAASELLRGVSVAGNAVRNHGLTLSSPISEGGLNLSQGQRQLLCLARSIVAPCKVMVLDEATSAVDMDTDTIIQRSIREDFVNSTLLVIAHRLSTVADFDKVLVMDEGHVVEYGTPRELWDRGLGHGVFRGMCEQSGEKEHLRRIICE